MEGVRWPEAGEALLSSHHLMPLSPPLVNNLYLEYSAFCPADVKKMDGDQCQLSWTHYPSLVRQRLAPRDDYWESAVCMITQNLD